MAKLGSPELGARWQNDNDVIAAQLLADLLYERGEFEQADKIQFLQEQYVNAWQSVSSTLNELFGNLFPIKEYDSNVNRWRDADTGQFVSSPHKDEDFYRTAQELRLIEGGL